MSEERGQGAGGGLIPREQALEAHNLLRAQGLGDYFERLEIAGSVRRGRPMVHDLDLVGIPKPACTFAVAERMRAICADLKSFRAGPKMVSAVIGNPTRTSTDEHGRTPTGQGAEVQVDVYFATEENWGMLMVVRTGSAQHNVYMAKLAQTLNLKFAAGSGVLDRDGNVLGARTEEEVFGAFGLVVPRPEDREIVNGNPKWTYTDGHGRAQTDTGRKTT